MAATLTQFARLKSNAEYETWQLNKVSGYDLVWRLTPNGFWAAVFHAGMARCVTNLYYQFDILLRPQEAKEQLKAIIDNHDWLQASNYNTVKVSWGWSGCIFIPGDFFDLSSLDLIAEKSLGPIAEGQRGDFYRHASGVVTVFYLNTDAADFLDTTYRASRIKNLHNNAVFAQQVQDMGAIGGTVRAAALLEKGFITIVVIDGKDWKIINRYAVKTPQEITYFTLLALQEVGLEAANVPLSLYGDTEANPEWYQPLLKFMPMAGLGNLPSAWGAHGVNTTDLAPWFATFAVTACV